MHYAPMLVKTRYSVAKYNSNSYCYYFFKSQLSSPVLGDWANLLQGEKKKKQKNSVTSCNQTLHVLSQLVFVVANHAIKQNSCLMTNQKVSVINLRRAVQLPGFRCHALSGCKAVVDWLAQSEAGLLQPAQEASEVAVGQTQELSVRLRVVFGLFQKDSQPRNTFVVRLQCL